jgi:hypothetical protein
MPPALVGCLPVGASFSDKLLNATVALMVSFSHKLISHDGKPGSLIHILLGILRSHVELL